MKVTYVPVEILTEGTWDENYTAGIAMKKYPNKFVHFSDVNKIGINPKKTHRDPYGIYFYPINWLTERMHGGYQYGTSMKYYYIVDIDLNAIGSVELTRMSLAKARGIATKNGWVEWFDKIYNNPEQYLSSGPMDKNLWQRKKIGAIFYATMDYLANVKRTMTWLQMLKGVPLLSDAGQGIINENEKAQVLVLDRKVMRILDFGENISVSERSNNESAIIAVEKLNGKHYYKNGYLNADVELDGAPVHLIFDLGNLKMKAEYYYKGIKGGKTFKVGFEELERSKEDLATSILYKINTLRGEIDKEGKEPVWGEKDIKELTDQILANTYKIERTSTKSGQLFSKIIFDSSYYMDHLIIWYTEDLEGNLEIYVGADVRGEPEKDGFEFHKTYKSTDTVEKIVTEFQKTFAKYIINRKDVKSGKRSAWRERLGFGLKYGNYGPDKTKKDDVEENLNK